MVELNAHCVYSSLVADVMIKCWCLLAITGQAVINIGLIEPLVDCMRGGQLAVRKEACWAITNALRVTEQQAMCVVACGHQYTQHLQFCPCIITKVFLFE
jgi:hypothetical protein